METQIQALLKHLNTPGWKTSELHVVLIAFALIFLLSQGIISTNIIPAQYGWVIWVYRFILSVLAIVPVAAKYIDSRQSVKDSLFELLMNKPGTESTQ